MEKETNFERITASPEALATLLASLHALTGPWDAAFDRAFCAACGVQDCNAEGCPHQGVRANVILWWLTMAGVEGADTDANRLRDLLERATPKTPVRDSLADRACPACGAYIPWDALNEPVEYAPPFCKNCGQALDWSKEGQGGAGG